MAGERMKYSSSLRDCELWCRKEPIVGNGKKSHDRQLDTLLPEPKSIGYPENRQITVSKRLYHRAVPKMLQIFNI